MTPEPRPGERPGSPSGRVPAGPSLGQLEAIVTVVDYGSFTAAADVLRISQPALSRRIHTLEAALGMRLFLPAGRRMALTDSGRDVVTVARRALREMESIEAMTSAARALVRGSLRVTGLPSLVAAVATTHVGRFHRRFPGVRVEVFAVEDAEELVEAVRLGRADAAVGVSDRVPEDLAVVDLRDQRFTAVLPGPRPDGGAEEQVSDEDLAHRTLVTLPGGTSIREITDSVYHARGVLPPRSITTTQRDALVQLSIAADAITIVPEELARTAPAFGGRAVRLPAPVHRPIGLLYRDDPYRSPALEGFLALARAPS